MLRYSGCFIATQSFIQAYTTQSTHFVTSTLLIHNNTRYTFYFSWNRGSLSRFPSLFIIIVLSFILIVSAVVCGVWCGVVCNDKPYYRGLGGTEWQSEWERVVEWFNTPDHSSVLATGKPTPTPWCSPNRTTSLRPGMFRLIITLLLGKKKNTVKNSVKYSEAIFCWN